MVLVNYTDVLSPGVSEIIFFTYFLKSPKYLIKSVQKRQTRLNFRFGVYRIFLLFANDNHSGGW